MFWFGGAMFVCALVVFGAAQIDVDLGADGDGDGMGDEYELFYGLNPGKNDDAAMDYDGDGLSNLDESKKLTDPFFPDTDRDGFGDIIDSNAVSRAYLRWGDPQFTDGDQYEYAHPDWLLGAYKSGGEWVTNQVSAYGSNGVSGWYVSVHGDNLPAVSTPQAGGVGSLCIDLDRAILTNNLVYAIRYSAGRNAALYVDLLDTNSLVVVEDLYGNLSAENNAGIQSTNSIIFLNIPTAELSDAAVIQLRCGKPGDLSGEALPTAEGAKTEVIVYEGLLYIDEDGDGLDADQEKQGKTSDYCIDSNGNGTNDYDECFNSGSSTNNSVPPPPPQPPSPGDDDKDKKKGIIYVDQVKGNDNLTGYACDVSGKHGPKKTVRGGLSVAETKDTIVIRSGHYNENLNISGKDVKVFIEGKVKL